MCFRVRLRDCILLGRVTISELWGSGIKTSYMLQSAGMMFWSEQECQEGGNVEMTGTVSGMKLSSFETGVISVF